MPLTISGRRLGRVVSVVRDDTGTAMFGGRRVDVRSLRGGPLCVGDRVVTLRVAGDHVLVDVRSGGCRYPLAATSWRVAPA
jgi:hypothetical protein